MNCAAWGTRVWNSQSIFFLDIKFGGNKCSLTEEDVDDC